MCSGRVTFTPPLTDPLQYSVFQGFVCAVSVSDKHFTAVAVTAQKHPGLQVLPKGELVFPRVLVDEREVEYLIIRNATGTECSFVVRFRSMMGAGGGGGGGGGAGGGSPFRITQRFGT